MEGSLRDKRETSNKLDSSDGLILLPRYDLLQFFISSCFNGKRFSGLVVPKVREFDRSTELASSSARRCRQESSVRSHGCR